MRVAITGGARGIGAAVVARLNAAGHAVKAFDLAEPADAERWVEVDLADPALITAAVAGVDGPFDALINNAGIPPRVGNAEAVLRVNWFGFRHMLNAMLPKLAPGAASVNTASRAGAYWADHLDEVRALHTLALDDLLAFIAERGIDATRAYNLSKEAVIVMTLARTEEMLTRGLRMNAGSPAAVETEILDDFVAAFGDRVHQNMARAGRAGTAEEVANVITFLASPESHWIKGQDITVDGGMSALSVTEQLGLKQW